nr:immunoglobulin light chain junction region [Mus musculus]NSL97256.1 immunoglobulin light chain junction region [Mus musculus]NSL97367.1 immunoglobulin light chain junction region [Mus musculus]NSL97558.1 immunoglobulin light chain junction region [Mus musculus]NSL97738.1 immunoglobulin light chain junction region [Mus musculus]
CQQGQSYPYTF